LERGFEDLLWRVSRARRHWGVARDPLPHGAGARELEPLLDELGRRLSEAFLPASIAEALAADIAEAERLNSPLELALELNDSMAELPWETLRLAGDGVAGLPLALHPRVDLYRRLKSSCQWRVKFRHFGRRKNPQIERTVISRLRDRSSCLLVGDRGAGARPTPVWMV
jgi:hypothetical protein